MRLSFVGLVACLALLGGVIAANQESDRVVLAKLPLPEDYSPAVLVSPLAPPKSLETSTIEPLIANLPTEAVAPYHAAALLPKSPVARVLPASFAFSAPLIEPASYLVATAMSLPPRTRSRPTISSPATSSNATSSSAILRPGVSKSAMEAAAWTFPGLSQDLPPWRRFAVAASAASDRPRIAIILDDLGLNRVGTWESIGLPGPLTLSFMSYAEGLASMTAAARGKGHELLLHVPMEPRGPAMDPGPNALLTGLPPAELRRRLDWALSRFVGFVGVNNHMGSKFTSSRRDVELVMQELKERGLLFVDSKTIGGSLAEKLAERWGVPTAGRDVFLDHDMTPAAIEAALRQVESLARSTGQAIAIGHPHRITLDALAAWLPTLGSKGFDLVPISSIVRQRFEVAQRLATAG